MDNRSHSRRKHFPGIWWHLFTLWFFKDKRGTVSRATLPLIKTFYVYLESDNGQFLLHEQRQAGIHENVRTGSDKSASFISLFDLHNSLSQALWTHVTSLIEILHRVFVERCFTFSANRIRKNFLHYVSIFVQYFRETIIMRPSKKTKSR
jgi:hypothetical protein